MLKQEITSKAAWQAFRQKNYDLAARIWLELMQASDCPELHNLYRFNYSYVLLAQGKNSEVQAILQELYEMTGNPFFLHRMSYVASEAGDLPQARNYLIEQRRCLELTDHRALAANAYELSLIGLLQNRLDVAIDWAHDSLQHAQADNDLLAEGAAHRLLGDVMMAVQKKDQAQQHYQAAFLAYANIQPNASASLDSINRLTG